MDEMKILELVDSYYPAVDGVINAVKNYSKELNKIASCKLAVPKASKKAQYVDSEEFDVYRCHSMGAPENYRNAFPTLDWDFLDLIEKEQVDIMHVHSPFSMGYFAVDVAREKNVPLVATLHTRYFYDFMRVTKSKILSKVALSYIMNVYKNADSVWTVSDAAKSVLREYGYKGKVEVVRNGTDFTYPENAEELINKVNEKHNLSGQKNVFLFVGRIALYKNVLMICDAMKILKERGCDFKMVFVGGGFDFETLKKYVDKNKLNDVCILTGEIKDRSDLQGYYLRSDLLIFPSTFDTSGIVKFEAAAHKTPALLIEGSCSAETVEDGVNGFLCQENANSIADKISEVILDEDKLKSVSEKAFATLYRPWSVVAEEVKAKYAEIIIEYAKKQRKKERLERFRKAFRKRKKQK